MGTVQQMRAIPDPLYGVTFDNESGASNAKLATHKTALAGLATPHLPISRIVFDEGIAPTEYVNAVDTLKPVSYLMGELLDSFYMNRPPYANPVGQPNGAGTAVYIQRARDYLNAFGEKVDIWEVGNEIGGKWAGPYPDQLAKIAGAFDVVKQFGKKSALTLWYNVGCESSNELTPLQFIDQYITPDAPRMLTGVDYVFISYYEVPCNNNRPSVATWKTFFQAVHTRFPNAKLGFGEVGLESRTTSTTLGKAQSIANFYYSLSPLLALSYYVGGYFWWYAAQDIVPWPGIMGNTLKTAMAGY